MLELINEKRSEYMMAESLYLDEGDGYTEDVLLPYPSQAPIPAPPALSKFEVYNDPVEFADIDQIAISVRKQLNGADFNLTFCPWNFMGTGNVIGLTEVLCVVQSLSLCFQVAQEDQKTFTDLVRQLVGRCGSDIEKAR